MRPNHCGCLILVSTLLKVRRAYRSAIIKSTLKTRFHRKQLYIPIQIHCTSKWDAKNCFRQFWAMRNLRLPSIGFDTYFVVESMVFFCDQTIVDSYNKISCRKTYLKLHDQNKLCMCLRTSFTFSFIKYLFLDQILKAQNLECQMP